MATVEMTVPAVSSDSKYDGGKLIGVLRDQVKLLNDPRSYKADKLGLSLTNGDRALNYVRNLFDAPAGLGEEHLVKLCTMPNSTFLDIQESLTRDAQRSFADNYLYVRDHKNGFPAMMWTIVQNTSNFVEEGDDFLKLFHDNNVDDPESFHAWLLLDVKNNFIAIKEVLQPEAAAEFQLCWDVAEQKGGFAISTEVPSGIGIKNAAETHLKLTHMLLAGVQIFVIVILAIFGSSDTLSPTFFTDDASGSTATRAMDGYNLYVGVMIMMLVGFGYLMTFMKYYGLGAVGFCLIVTAIGLQWGLIWESFFDQWYHNDWHDIPLDMYTVYITTTMVAVPLISLGGVIGKITPLQLIIMVLVEFVFHAILSVLLYGYLKLTDIGATYGIHMFGCYFGLAVSWVLGAPVTEPEGGHVPDLFSLIGTVFLWIYWPSFVGGFLEVDSDEQQHALVNTILALLSSTVMAFVGSSWFNPSRGSSKFRPVDIQNATLAGGVAIGCLANLRLNPGLTLLVGAFCGLLSSFGYCYVQPFLLEKFNLHDTCGINNLHGMPSIAGALISVFVAGIASDSAQQGSYYYKQDRQAIAQFAAILLTLSFAISTGLITAKLMQAYEIPEGMDSKKFHDAVWWELGEEEETSIVGNADNKKMSADDNKA